MKKIKTKGMAVAYLVICVVVGAVFLGTALSSRAKLDAPSTDIYSLTSDTIKPGMRVSGKAGFVLDVFATYGDDSKNDNQYYIIVAGEDHSFYMALEEYPKQFAALDKEIERSWRDDVTFDNVTEGSEYQIDGIVEELDGELLQFFDEFFIDSELYTAEELAAEYGYSVVPYYIRPVSNNLTGWYVGLGVGILFILLGLFTFIFSMKRINQQEKDEQYLTTMGTKNEAAKGLRDSSSVSSTIQDNTKPPMGFE